VFSLRRRGGGHIGLVAADVDLVGPGANGIEMGADVGGVKTLEDSASNGNELRFALFQGFLF
jgi:hypothetical protein